MGLAFLFASLFANTYVKANYPSVALRKKNKVPHQDSNLRSQPANFTRLEPYHFANVQFMNYS